MSNITTDMRTWQSAIAIAQDGKRLKAVKLKKQGTAIEVLWTKSTEAGDLDWKAFELECGLAAESTGKDNSSSNKMVVAGFDSAGVVFYRLDLPTVPEEEIAAMVKLQAEVRMPLPADKMELAWRADQAQNGKVPVTIAAARKEPLEKFVENIRGFDPAKILLDCEGIVKAWRASFSGDGRDAVVVSMTERNTQVCLAQNGRLSNAVVLDTGTEDLSETNQDPFAFVAGRSVDQTETAERFVQDIRSILELFGHAEPAGLPIFVLSDNSGAHEIIVSSLKSAGLSVRAAYPQIAKLDTQTRISPADIYQYRLPIGLALTALDGDKDQLNIFEHLYRPLSETKRKRRLYSMKTACAVAAIMLVLLLIASYAVDIASPGAIEKRLNSAGVGTEIDQLIQRQKLIKSVASERPDLLQLLDQINEAGSQGVLLDKLDFKKGRLASISGQAQRAEQVYEFQESLLTQKGITNVKIQSTTQDNKTKKLKFTIIFHYKKFTQSKGRARR
jgi:hypothetical protein